MNERSIFLEAIDKDDPTQRSAYLDTACAGDDALRHRVEALLESHTAAGNVLDKLAPERIAEELAQTDGETQGETSENDVVGDDLGFLTPADKPGVLGRLAHYEVLEVIGKGGMGIVLRAFDEKLHRVVAIKVMAAQLATNAAARRRFTREAQAQAAVSHDHIVTIHAVEGDSPKPYLVMQYVAGLSLQQRLDRDGPLALHEILRIGMQTASGLAAAHAQGLVHRDVKPANILLENGVERVKITDFGLARAANEASLTQSGAVAGTPQYMSPEQAEGNAIDQRSDLFSLGSVLYAMCTGRAPFRASGTMAVLRRVCEETPSPIREVNPDIPDRLVAIIDKLHAKQPAERYQSAAEVAELLGRYLAHVQHPSIMPLPPEIVGAGSSQSGPMTDPAKTRRGWRRWWTIAAAVLLCLIGGLSVTEATGVTKLRATVIRVFTGDGTLIVEVNDPSVKVSIEGDGGLVITGAGPQEVRLRPGSYKLQAAKDGKPVRLDQELIAITRGDKQVVRVAVEKAGPPEARPANFVTPWYDTGDWVIKDGELQQLEDTHSYHHLLFGNPRWVDYDYEAEGQVIAGGTELGLVFRATGPHDRLNWTPGSFGNTSHLVVSNRGNSAVVAQMPGKIDRRRWYRLRVQARGSRFKVFLDGKLLMSFYTDAYPRGCVGVVTNASARFRNLKVADPNGKVLLEGVRNVLPKTKPSSATPVTPNVLIASPKRTKAQAVLELGAHLQNAVRLDPGDAGARFALGGFHAQWGEWKEAAAAYDRGLELDPTSYERWREAAVVHRAADDVEGYRRTCRQLVRRFGDTDNPAVADRIVITCLLLPDALPAADFDLVQQLAERAVTGTEKHAFYRYFAKTKGLAEYRAGRHARAVKWLDRCPEADAGLQDALLLTYRAMARHGLGQTGEAVAALGRARALLATMPDPAAGRQPVTDWHGLMYGWLLYREAESLLKKK